MVVGPPPPPFFFEEIAAESAPFKIPGSALENGDTRLQLERAECTQPIIYIIYYVCLAIHA